MNLESTRCPICGGNIEIEANLTIYECAFCGNKLNIKKENKEIDNHLSIAFDMLSHRNYIGAKFKFNEIMGMDSQNGEVYLGLLMCSLCVPSKEKLNSAKSDYSNNPNYLKACELLDTEQSAKLKALCNENNEKLQNAKKTFSPTDNMRLFKEANIVYINGKYYSVYSYFAGIDFDQMSEETIVSMYEVFKKNMGEAIRIFAKLSTEEINHLQYFNAQEWERGKQVFYAIKEALQEYSQEN